MFIDLKPYLNPAPHVVSEDTSLHKVSMRTRISADSDMWVRIFSEM